MKNSIRHLLAASVVTVAISVPASAQSPSAAIESATRINSANALVREGRVAEAIADYQRVQATEANHDELNYNLAVAEYREGKIEAAKALFTESASSVDTSLAASSRYNLGNCFYSDAVKAVEQDKPAAIASLHQAISHYRGSLAGNPNNVDARANIELAAELLKKLQAEQQQKSEDQQQDQDHQQSDDEQQQDKQDSKSGKSESSKDQSQQGDEQKESAQQEQNSGQQDQPSESKSDAQQSEDQAQQNQSDPHDSLGDESKDAQSKGKDSKPGEQSQAQPSEQRQSSEQNASEQQSKNQAQSQQDMQSRTGDQQPPKDATADEERDETEQVVPAGELSAASEQDADGKPNGRVAIDDPNAKDGLMTKQEALKMLQAVRDRDMLRRLKQEQVERSRHITVDRDW